MTEMPTPEKKSDLSWLLEGLVTGTPGARSAVVASDDGLRKAVFAIDGDEADKLSAIATALLSLGVALRDFKGVQGGLRQVMIEHDGCFLFVTAAGSRALLCVLTDTSADVGMIGHAMQKLVNGVETALATPPRTETAPPGVRTR